eukprot:NODE_6362_length_513_cov_181.941048.p2 GENE.NODE_6362_length_513_cov_181.941048~~NODE_6362_length_513_cov_181.941048.p2  ORF type:complete len:132 (-),score=23.28 NODE_6362_length_513_cov_181.941048:100-495(-)
MGASQDVASACPVQLPQFPATPDAMKDLTIINTLLSWNCPVLPADSKSCCNLHGIALRELAQVVSRLQSSDCARNFEPHHGWQCPICLLMDYSEGESKVCCLMCGHSESRNHFRRQEEPADDASTAGPVAL